MISSRYLARSCWGIRDKYIAVYFVRTLTLKWEQMNCKQEVVSTMISVHLTSFIQLYYFLFLQSVPRFSNTNYTIPTSYSIKWSIFSIISVYVHKHDAYLTCLSYTNSYDSPTSLQNFRKMILLFEKVLRNKYSKTFSQTALPTKHLTSMILLIIRRSFWSFLWSISQ